MFVSNMLIFLLVHMQTIHATKIVINDSSPRGCKRTTVPIIFGSWGEITRCGGVGVKRGMYARQEAANCTKAREATDPRGFLDIARSRWSLPGKIREARQERAFVSHISPGHAVLSPR